MNKRRRELELAVILMLGVFLLAIDVNYYVVMAIAMLMIALFELKDKEHLQNLGITTKRIWPSIKVQLPFTIAGIIGLAVFALYNGYGIRVPSSDYAPYFFISVPVQEFIFRGYIQELLRGLLPRIPMVLTVSIIFSLVHYFTDTGYLYILILVTLAAGFAWGYAYEKERNLIGPTLSHMILGVLIFLILPINAL